MYFAALLARTEDGWEASDLELDDVESLSDLIDLARSAAVDDDTVVALIEQEDAWFGVVRVDGEEDPRYFVSNASAADRSSYGSMLTKELLAASTRTTISTNWTWTAPRTGRTSPSPPTRTRRTTRTTTGRAPAPSRCRPVRSATPGCWTTSASATGS